MQILIRPLYNKFSPSIQQVLTQTLRMYVHIFVCMYKISHLHNKFSPKLLLPYSRMYIQLLELFKVRIQFVLFITSSHPRYNKRSHPTFITRLRKKISQNRKYTLRKKTDAYVPKVFPTRFSDKLSPLTFMSNKKKKYYYRNPRCRREKKRKPLTFSPLRVKCVPCFNRSLSSPLIKFLVSKVRKRKKEITCIDKSCLNQKTQEYQIGNFNKNIYVVLQNTQYIINVEYQQQKYNLDTDLFNILIQQYQDKDRVIRISTQNRNTKERINYDYFTVFLYIFCKIFILQNLYIGYIKFVVQNYQIFCNINIFYRNKFIFTKYTIEKLQLQQFIQKNNFLQYKINKIITIVYPCKIQWNYIFCLNIQ
eukprot:TRINITY_DN366_c0_g1_i8.p1 TRINITY_DN366_c0_g1~~TRINITY_DN366_c0_g1_i8.p1  ORF type:complete len:364 (+),score=-22.81 TRINITY_DN366_c0_g1_i8:615-1706(+)